MTTYTHIVHAAALALALDHARGAYQRALINDGEAWSGATLQGKAKSYGGHYARSRDGLLARLEADPRLVITHLRGDHNRREVSIALDPILAMIAARCTRHVECNENHEMALACGPDTRAVRAS